MLGIALQCASQTDTLPMSVTFNDEQTMLTEQPKSVSDLERAIAVRASCRAFDLGQLDKETSKTLRTLAVEKTFACTDFTGGLVKVLDAIRHAYGLPNANVALGVDELAKAADNDPKRSREFLSYLCTQVMDPTPWLRLVVTSFGMVDVQHFVTGSNRPLKLLPLPPVFPITSGQVNLLPPLLQPFADEAQKRRLLFEKDWLQRYAKISLLLFKTGGHPRIVETLLGRMNLALTKDGLDKHFYDALQNFCLQPNLNLLNSDMQDIVTFNDGAKVQLFSDPAVASAFYRDLVVPFPFPTSVKEATDHKLFLRFSSGQVCCGYLQGLAYLPGPALKQLPDQATELRALGDGMEAFVTNFDRQGKEFERLCARAIQVFLHCYGDARPQLKLSSILQREREFGPKSVFNVRLQAGRVGWNDTCKVFPSSYPDNESLTVDASALQSFIASNLAAAVVIPQAQCNLCCDFAIFLRHGLGRRRVLVLYCQCKDWFRGEIRGERGVENLWTRFKRIRQFVESDQVPSMQALNTDGAERIGNGFPRQVRKMKASVTHGFVLVTANPIDTLFPGENKLSDLKEDEAVIDLEAMKSWFPTGGYNCQLAVALRRMFSFSGSDKGQVSE